MSENTSIEWCHHTFNTHWGCHEVSSGCDNCYARSMANRFGVQWGIDTPRREFGDKHWAEPLKWDRKAAAAGVRHRVFSNSMSDLFDKNAPAGVRERWFELTKATPNLDWLALTKRIGNVPRMLPADWGAGYRNVWLGISVVNQEEAERDIVKLLSMAARVRFLSVEPMLGPVDLSEWMPIENVATTGWRRRTKFGEPDSGLDWVIVGGESGAKARPMHPGWVRDIRDQCVAAGVAFMFKQNGEFASVSEVEGHGAHFTFLDGETVRRVGKKAAGRLLDGVQHDGYPEVTR